MQRRHLIELEDLEFWPQTFRDGCTEYLQTVLHYANPYQAMLPRIALAIQKCQATDVLDLCSGAGGPWLQLLPALQAAGCNVEVIFSDKFPNLVALERLATLMTNTRTVSYPVDATDVPCTLSGFRTLFGGFHHLQPNDAQRVLSSAVRDRQGIAVFELTNRSLRSLTRMLLSPIGVWVLTPFVRPFRWSRLFWTYVIPVLPLAILFDGLVSCLRTYTPEDLRKMVARVDCDSYQWDFGVENVPGTTIPITFLIGVPRVIS